jgi:four helix bundle protein
MQFKAKKLAEFTSARVIVWSADYKSTITAERHPQKMISRGPFCDLKNLLPEARLVGLNGNSNNLVDAGNIGWQNEATPSEGAKRRYEAHFISKLTDCDGLRLGESYGSESENSETDSSLDFAKDCGYITDEQHAELAGLCQEVGKMIGSMIKNPAPFLISDR